MKKPRILYYYEKLVDVKYIFFKNIFAHLFLMHLINPTKTNSLFLGLIHFELYRKNMQIQLKSIHIFLIGLGIRFSRNRTKLACERS